MKPARQQVTAATERQVAAPTVARPFRILGIDPGFAQTGVAVLEDGAAGVQVRALEVLKTTKQKKTKGMIAVRAAIDDGRRLDETYHGLVRIFDLWEPHVVCFEVFAPFPGQGGGNAWKTAMTVGLINGIVLQRGLLLLAFLPSDIKRAFSLTKGATKTAIGEAVTAKVGGMKDLLERITKGKREHVTDAAAHAYLGFSHVAALRQATGGLR